MLGLLWVGTGKGCEEPRVEEPRAQLVLSSTWCDMVPAQVRSLSAPLSLSLQEDLSFRDLG